MFTIHIVTLFPEMFDGPLDSSIVGRAQVSGLVSVQLHQLRNFATGRHRKVDGQPFGGGPGMVLKPDPIFRAVETIAKAEIDSGRRVPRVLVTSPQGRLFSQAFAEELVRESSLTIVCGHYEGIDERVMEHLADDRISIGEYVLTGGELPAMVIADTLVRLLPGALGSPASAPSDSFSTEAGGGLKGPVYTRPRDFRGWMVPDVLLSGDHARIKKWTAQQSGR